MKILAVDTATKSCSVAVVSEKSIISEYTVNHKDTHSRFVMGMVHDILKMSHLTVKDLDGFAVTIGPGSFTGLRIGLSTVKGLSLAAGKPVAGISSLEALACTVSGTESLICPMLDARRNEVYTGRYRLREGRLVNESPPRAVRPDKAVKGINESCIMVGDGAIVYQDLIKNCLGPLAVFADFFQHTIRASAVGFMAIERFTSHNTDDPGLLKPLYLRKSDAQKNLKPSAITDFTASAALNR